MPRFPFPRRGMTDLPASIEAYLTDAGFSATEITVLKKLLEGEALTLRELAAKTGKSTGVLDAAAKKLLQRRIASRETVNDTPKLLIRSLESVCAWVRRDTEEKLAATKSRARDFETFLASLALESVRPEIEHFEGEEGVKKAYVKLLDLAAKELLHERPVTEREEEDPLRDFRVQYFRQRHHRGVFSRVLAPDTPLGRRFQSRDAFEYRETQLVSPSEFPITFEKIIAGDAVACFTRPAHSAGSGQAGSGQAGSGSDGRAQPRACILRYPELAHTERAMFELLWRRAKEPPASAGAPPPASSAQPPLIPLSTRSLSSLREFLLSRKSVALFFACAGLAALLTYGLWRHTYNVNLQRERERALSIVTMGATQFDPDDLDRLHTIDDITKPEYAKAVKKLREIRSENKGIAYAYIMRPQKDKKGYWEYIADADSLDPFAKIDANHDGMIDEKDQLQYPGYLYDEFDPYFDIASKGPFSTPDIHTDQYGTYFTTSTPILGTSGRSTKILCVDILIEDISFLTRKSFPYFPFFVGLFFLFVFIRLAAFNRPLFFELLKVLRSRTVLTVLGACALIAGMITFGLWRYTNYLNLQRVREQGMTIAATAAAEFEAADIDQLRSWHDVNKPAYKKVVQKLQDLRRRNPRVKYAYIMRATSDPYFYQFVADADSGDIYVWKDLNNDNLKNDQVPPGYLFLDPDAIESSLYRALDKPVSDVKPFTDPWGTWVSGHAPIRDQSGRTVAIIGVDVDASEVSTLSRQTLSPIFLFSGILFLLVFVRLVTFRRSVFLMPPKRS